MTGEDFAHLSDAEIVEYFREASLRCAKCGFNAPAANRIYDSEMTPAYEALAARGPEALRALVALTDDPDANVRTDAAIFAYRVDPGRCRAVLQQVIDGPGWVGAIALVGLLQKDPEFSARFSHEAKLKYQRYLEESGRGDRRPKQ